MAEEAKRLRKQSKASVAKTKRKRDDSAELRALAELIVDCFLRCQKL